MRSIKWATEIISGNLAEARKYIMKAYELRDQDRQAADWCRDMAAKHVDFNAAGHNLVKRMIEDVRAKDPNNAMVAGMRAVFEDKHADMMQEQAEIVGMINAYK